jgi:hypothetical protein
LLHKLIVISRKWISVESKISTFKKDDLLSNAKSLHFWLNTEGFYGLIIV